MSADPSPALPPTTPGRPGRPGRPVRLAVVSDAVLPWHHGGKEQRHHELCTRLARRGFAVTVYTMHSWDGPRRTRVGDVEYVALCRERPLYHGGRRSILQAVVFALACLRLVVHRFDVVEADAIPFLPLVPVRLVCWVRRRPMVTTWHEFWGRDYWVSYLGAKGRLAALVESTAVRIPDRIVAASEETAGRLRGARRGPRDVVVVPNGVAVRPTGAGAAAEAPPHRTPGRSRLLVAGRLLENKRVDVALGTLAELTRRGVDVELEVVGDGPEREPLERLAEQLQLDERVRFTSFLPSHDDVLARMAQADVLLFPSVREGFGMVALEAMSVGTPVVTSDHLDNAARHLVRTGHNGAVAPVVPAAFADAVEQVLADAERLGAGARTTAADYDWDRLADQVAAAYLGQPAPVPGSANSAPSGADGLDTWYGHQVQTTQNPQ